MPTNRELTSRECRHVSDELSAYVDGRAEPKQKALIERHLAECAQCAAELEQLRCLVDAIRATPPVRSPRSFALSPEMVRERPRRSWLNIWSSLAPAVAGAAALILAALFFVDYRLQTGGGLVGAGAPSAASAPQAARPADSAAPVGPAPLVAVTAPVFVTATPEPVAEPMLATQAPAAADSAAPSSEARSEFGSAPEPSREVAPPAPSATVAPTLSADIAPPAAASLSAQASSAAEEVAASEEPAEPEEPALAAAGAAPAELESAGETPLPSGVAPYAKQVPTAGAEAVAVPEAPMIVAEAPAVTADIPGSSLKETTESSAPAALAAAPPGPARGDGTADGSVGSVSALEPESPLALRLAQVLAGILLLASLITWGARLRARRA